MPNYPSSFDNGVAPGQRTVNNVTSRRDFKYFLSPSAGSLAGFAVTYATAAVLPNSAVALGSTAIVCGAVGTTLVVDGTNVLSTNNTILVKNQSTASQNGIYQLTTVGASGVSWFLTRHTSFDIDAELKLNAIYSVDLGTANTGTKWYISTEEPITVGTTNIAFTAVPTTVTYNSTAKYASDVNVGIERIGALNSTYNRKFIQDFQSMINMMQSELNDLETSFASVSADGLKWMASSNIYNINNLYRKMEKMVFRTKELRDDIDRMNTVGFNATFPGMGLTSRYPSGYNRLTNSAGGY